RRRDGGAAARRLRIRMAQGGTGRARRRALAGAVRAVARRPGAAGVLGGARMRRDRRRLCRLRRRRRWRRRRRGRRRGGRGPMNRLLCALPPIWREAVEELWRRRLRTGLTLLGLVFGVGAIVAM